MVEGQSECLILRFVPARADTQDQAPVAHLVDRRRHFRQDRGSAEGIACHECADLYALCRFGQGREHGPAFPDSPSRLTRITIEEMVRKPDTIKTIRLRLLRNRTDRIIAALAVLFASVRQ